MVQDTSYSTLLHTYHISYTFCMVLHNTSYSFVLSLFNYRAAKRPSASSMIICWNSDDSPASSQASRKSLPISKKCIVAVELCIHIGYPERSLLPSSLPKRPIKSLLLMLVTLLSLLLPWSIFLRASAIC